MKIPKLAKKDLVSLTDLTAQEIFHIFNLAARLKKDHAGGKRSTVLEGKTLAMIFEKNSTRTRVSFEAGMFQLGGSALFLSRDDIQLGRGETVADTARVLSRYVDAIMIRTDRHSKVEELAANASIPVINGLSDTYHPCQALADFFTIYEREKKLEKIKLAYLGDGNNVAHSLLIGAAMLGMDISIASPKAYQPDSSISALAFNLSSSTGSRITVTTDIDLAVRDADYLYTDVWTSMGREKEAARRKKLFTKYKITKNILKKCSEKCAVMHCLPANRGEEIDGDVIDSECSIVFDQAENRMHVQKALLCSLMKK